MKVVKIGDHTFYAADKNNTDENRWLSQYSGNFIKLDNGTEYKLPVLNSKQAKRGDSTPICLYEINGVKYYPVKFGGEKYVGSQVVRTTTSNVSFGGFYVTAGYNGLILEKRWNGDKKLDGEVAYIAECSLASGVSCSFTVHSSFFNENSGSLSKSGTLSSSFSGQTNCKPLWGGQVTDFLKVWLSWKYNGKVIASDYCFFRAFLWYAIVFVNFYHHWYETFRYTQNIVRKQYVSIATNGSLSYRYEDTVTGSVSKDYHEGCLIKDHEVSAGNRDFL